MITLDQYKMYYIEPKLGGAEQISTGTCSFIRVGGSIAFYSNDIYGGFDLEESESEDKSGAQEEIIDLVRPDIQTQEMENLGIEDIEADEMVNLGIEDAEIVEVVDTPRIEDVKEKRVRFQDEAKDEVRGEINVEDIDTLIERMSAIIKSQK